MKRKKVQRIISCVVFAVLLVLAIAKCTDVLEYKEAKKKYTPFYESKTNFDVIFLGTSHMYNHVLPMEMWSEYGISSYNWGYSNCTPAENYYLIQDILKYTSPKVVVMDVYGLTEYNNFNNGKYRTDRIEQQHVQFDSLPIFSISKYKASKDVFDDYDNNEDFIWNFIMYHNRWTELGKNDFEFDITTEKGAEFLSGLGMASYTPISENETTLIDSVCFPYYLEIIEYCEQQGVEVLCVYLPFAASAQQQKIANTIGDVVEQYSNCSYVNMLNKNILDFDIDVYSDNGHLNYSGASKVSSWLGQYLIENYELDDYSMNEYWEKDYQAYYDYKVKKLKNCMSLPECLVQLRDDDFRAEVQIYDANLMKSDRLMSLFENAGIEPKFVPSENDMCACLVIYSSEDEKMVADIKFSCMNTENLDIFNIKKLLS